MQKDIIKKLVLTPALSKKLHRLQNPPTQLSYIGSNPCDILTKPAVAIVGTRKMSAYGKAVTEKIANDLARAGVCVISGNALGVDVTAQKAAVQAGGKVVAVVASGLDKVYPATNARVADEIVRNGGAIVSEYEIGHMPRPEEFLERNRIIAALSDIVIVTEAAQRSGSLNTALHAKNAGVPVFTVPGSITSSLSEGPHTLIKEGAKILTSAEDVLHFLGITKHSKQLNLVGANEVETKLLELVSEGHREQTSMHALSGVDYATFQSALTMLEINGQIKQDSLGNWLLS